MLDPLQEFTQSCLRHEAKLRPTAHDLLFHRVLFEVHSLKLLAAHCLINNQCEFFVATRWAIAPLSALLVIFTGLFTQCLAIAQDF